MIDDITRDLEEEASFDRARRLARADVADGAAPRELVGELAAFQTEYDDEYTAAQLEVLS